MAGAGGPYWGHNAIIRIAPSAAIAGWSRCRTAAPSSATTRWRRYGCTPPAGRSAACPPRMAAWRAIPALPEFMARDLRWAAGNMQYWALLRLPGQTWMGRWQLVQAILLFLGAPLWVGVLVFGALNAATGGGAATPAGGLAALLLAGFGMLHAPKLAGYAEVLLRPAIAVRYGGRRAFLRGALAELGFTLLLDPISIVSKAIFLARLPFGGGAGWAPQNRVDRGVRWRDAARLLWPHTVFGLTVFGLLLATAPGAALWALPWAGGLVLAVPFCALTASPGVSAWLRARRVAATPEELAAAKVGAILC
ncbi:hypothetical protein ACFQU2_22190 [Siccirubricoccus deserti]